MVLWWCYARIVFGYEPWPVPSYMVRVRFCSQHRYGEPKIEVLAGHLELLNWYLKGVSPMPMDLDALLL